MICVRPMTLADVSGVVALQRLCFPPPFDESLLWRPEHLIRHLEVFSAGQWVVLDGGVVVGSASAAVISESRWRSHQSWEEALGDHFFAHHGPGSTLYGADISVAPTHRGRGVGRALYRARFELVRESCLTRFGTACRMPDFAASGFTSPIEFARAVAEGRASDRTLSPLLSHGLSLVGVLTAYIDDAESGNAAARLEWCP